ncbi:TPA: hypothetical protein ACX6RV_001371 [Photobacterium damselae]
MKKIFITNGLGCILSIGMLSFNVTAAEHKSNCLDDDSYQIYSSNKDLIAKINLRDGAGYAEYLANIPSDVSSQMAYLCVPKNRITTLFSQENGVMATATWPVKSYPYLLNFEDFAGTHSLGIRFFDGFGYKQWDAENSEDTSIGDKFLYHSPFSGKVEIYQARHNGLYSYFPTTTKQNVDWVFIGNLEPQYENVTTNVVRLRLGEK